MTHDTQSRLDALISEQAAEWFIEFRTGDIDAMGRLHFDAWLRASPENLRAYVEVAAIWNESVSLAAQGPLDTEELIALARAERNVVPWPRRSGAAAPDPTESETAGNGAELQSVPLSAAKGIKGRLQRTAKSVAAPGSLWNRRLALAAGFLLVLIGGALLSWYELYRATEYSTEVGEQRSVRLSDGSTVQLNSRSKLRVRFDPSQRVVELIEGQALFHVAKNAARPFIVRSAQTSVRAVGTRFDVYKKQAGPVVTVIEGRVAVSGGFPRGLPSSDAREASNGSESSVGSRAVSPDPRGTASTQVDAPGAEDLAILLSAGEQLAVTARTTVRPTRANVAAATAWTQRELILDGAPLSLVAEEFNRYSSRRLIAEDHGDPELRLSGMFTTDPEFLIRYLRERPDIVVTETSSEVHIVRRRHP